MLNFPYKVLNKNLFLQQALIFQNALLTKVIMRNQMTAGIIIIGNEILKGHVQDSNSFYLIKKLSNLNINVKKISVVQDEVDEVSSEIRHFSSKYSVVLTSGGIGPTHDDITYEAIAKAFKDELHFHPILVEFCQEYFGSVFSSNSPSFKLAQIPKSSVLNFSSHNKTGRRLRFPLVSVRNVYVFPGIPALLERAFNIFHNTFRNCGQILHFKELFINRDEVSIAQILNTAVDKFKNSVTFGSYPAFIHNYYSCRITIESPENNSVDEAFNFLKTNLPSEYIVNYDKNFFLHAKEKVQSLTSSNCKVDSAIKIIENCLNKYSLSEICIALNGKKTSTALLHLVHSCIRKESVTENKTLQAFYVKRSNTFSQIEDFIQETVHKYNLSLKIYEDDMKDSLNQYVKSNPSVKILLLGNCPLNENLQQSNINFASEVCSASLIPVYPLTDWDDSDIWTFIRQLSLPYCILYDKGYTSIRNRDDSNPDERLKYLNHRKQISYHPAYILYNKTEN